MPLNCPVRSKQIGPKVSAADKVSLIVGSQCDDNAQSPNSQNVRVDFGFSPLQSNSGSAEHTHTRTNIYVIASGIGPYCRFNCLRTFNEKAPVPETRLAIKYCSFVLGKLGLSLSLSLTPSLSLSI